MKHFLLTLALLTTGLIQAQSNKKAQDIAAIKAMAGCYKVTFDFAETFSPDTTYKYHDRYHSWGIEYVFILKDSPDLISLQHLLIVNDTTIIKHWRQDWVFEETNLLSYHKDKTWKTTTFKPDEVKGTWTQKVFQVDDSPRYESKGTWVHVDGRHFWEGVGDAPLPRREFTKRNDYNVMTRKSRMELAADGWFLEQDNVKIIRCESGDKVLCHEKGMERFTTGNYNCQPAIDWWNKNKSYWSEVRMAWTEVFKEHPSITFAGKVEDKMLWQALFELGDEVAANGETTGLKTKAKAIILQYVKTT